MTAEQLEELLGKVRDAKERHFRINEHQAYYDLLEIAPSLARRVIAAEKLAEAISDAKETAAAQYKGNLYPENGDGWEYCVNDMLDCLDPALTAYREASK